MKRYIIVIFSVMIAGSGQFDSTAHSGTIDAYGPSSQGGAYVKSTTYYFCDSSNGTHTALDICVDTSGNKSSCSTCNATNVRAMLDGTYYYDFIGGCESTCSRTNPSCNGGAGNYAVVNGSNGYQFRELHMNETSDSNDKYASKGTFLGMLGSTGDSTAPHVHVDNRKNGTRLSAWYDGYVTCGDAASSTNVIGHVTLQ